MEYQKNGMMLAMGSMVHVSRGQSPLMKQKKEYALLFPEALT